MVVFVFGSTKRWDRWHSPSPDRQEKYHLYTTYSPCLRLGVIYVICYRSHPLQEPEKSIDPREDLQQVTGQSCSAPSGILYLKMKSKLPHGASQKIG